MEYFFGLRKCSLNLAGLSWETTKHSLMVWAVASWRIVGYRLKYPSDLARTMDAKQTDMHWASYAENSISCLQSSRRESTAALFTLLANIPLQKESVAVSSVIVTFRASGLSLELLFDGRMCTAVRAFERMDNYAECFSESTEC